VWHYLELFFIGDVGGQLFRFVFVITGQTKLLVVIPFFALQWFRAGLTGLRLSSSLSLFALALALAHAHAVAIVLVSVTVVSVSQSNDVVIANNDSNNDKQTVIHTRTHY
jgi:Tfp pilus assembly protein FimT